MIIFILFLVHVTWWKQFENSNGAEAAKNEQNVGKRPQFHLFRDEKESNARNVDQKVDHTTGTRQNRVRSENQPVGASLQGQLDCHTKNENVFHDLFSVLTNRPQCL